MIVWIKMVPHKKGNGLLDLLCFNDHKFDKGVTINVFLTKKVCEKPVCLEPWIRNLRV